MNDIIRNDTVDLIISRRTVRSYTPQNLTAEQITTLLECAKWAPSARNMQPCHVRVLCDKNTLDEMNTDFKNVVGWNTPAYTRWDTNPVYQGAPALIFIFAKPGSQLDAGLMCQNMVIAAQSLGLNSCIIGSIGALFASPEGKKWYTALKAPEGTEFMISVAVGTGAENPPVKEREDGHYIVL